MYICLPTHFISVHIFISININRCPASLMLLRSFQCAPTCMSMHVCMYRADGADGFWLL